MALERGLGADSDCLRLGEEQACCSEAPALSSACSRAPAVTAQRASERPTAWLESSSQRRARVMPPPAAPPRVQVIAECSPDGAPPGRTRAPRHGSHEAIAEGPSDCAPLGRARAPRPLRHGSQERRISDEARGGPPLPACRGSHERRISDEARGGPPLPACRQGARQAPGSAESHPRGSGGHRGSVLGGARRAGRHASLERPPQQPARRASARGSLLRAELARGAAEADARAAGAEGEVDREELAEGIGIHRPSEGPRAREAERSAPAPEMAAAARLLRCGPVFSGFSEKALADVAGAMEARTFRAGEPIYREGERQHWLGVLESGTASVHVALGASDQASAEQPLAVRAGSHIADIPEGGLFGELAALGIREHRTSTATAASAECRVLVLQADALARALQAHPDEEVLLTRAADRWRAFLDWRLAAQCHPELAYQLRRGATARVLEPGECLALGAGGAEPGALTGDGPSLSGSTAVVECGRAASMGEHAEAYGPGAAICDEAVLGVRGAATVVAGDRPCHLALVSRGAFWALAARFAREREAFVRLALDRLPLVTFDVLSCRMLAHLQGSPGFWRVVQSSVRQRVVHPGADVCGPGEEGRRADVLPGGARGGCHRRAPGAAARGGRLVQRARLPVRGGPARCDGAGAGAVRAAGAAPRRHRVPPDPPPRHPRLLPGADEAAPPLQEGPVDRGPGEAA
ncbi:unnamed protein product [Prorocentrum cordatum]|uniref:Cyclic nucleotide-binding domain-containing protein n=1 Tax=Prorocentrum cordatum TaxID=2364126 RepID=A0ABN9WV08_9DINO|nr:unnamed protein product [Polarella glacialis]